MIAWWWLVPALLGGAVLGILGVAAYIFIFAAAAFPEGPKGRQ